MVDSHLRSMTLTRGVSVSSAGVSADVCGCFGCTPPCVSCWARLSYSRYSCARRRSGHEVTSLSWPSGFRCKFHWMFPNLVPEIRPPACHGWLSPGRCASGCTFTAQPQRWHCPCLMRSRPARLQKHTTSLVYLLFFTASCGSTRGIHRDSA